MSGGLTSDELIQKALRAGASARVLLDVGDVDGACNRAYYAIFAAARAALLATRAPVAPDIGKPHGGLIAAFGLHLVKHGPVPREIGRLLKRAEEIRLVADYTETQSKPTTRVKWSMRPRVSSLRSTPC